MKTYYAYIRAVYVQRVPIEAESLDAAQEKADELTGEICPGLDGECTDWETVKVEEAN